MSAPHDELTANTVADGLGKVIKELQTKLAAAEEELATAQQTIEELRGKMEGSGVEAPAKPHC